MKVRNLFDAICQGYPAVFLLFWSATRGGWAVISRDHGPPVRVLGQAGQQVLLSEGTNWRIER